MRLRHYCLAAASALALAAASLAPSVGAAAVPSATDFARHPALSSVTLSPDGKRLAAVTSPDGRTRVISIWRTEALDKPPVVIGGNRRSDLIGVNFIKDDRLLVFVQQTYTAGTYKGHIVRPFITDLEGSEWRTALGEEDQNSTLTPTLLSRLPRDPKHILVDIGDVWKVNVYTGEKTRVDRASDRFAGKQVDLQGAVRARQEVNTDGKGVFIAQQLKHPATGAWEEHFRSYAKDRDFVEVVGFTEDPNIALLARAEGRDQPGVYLYDIRSRKVLEPAFEHKLFGAKDVVQGTAGDLRGFVYAGDRYKVHWIDPQLQQLDRDLRQALGVKATPVSWTDPVTGQVSRFNSTDGADIDIIDVSEDRKTFLIEKSGPKLPPEYYLLVAGKPVQLLGRSRPSLDTAALGDTRLVQYKARDGLMVPAFLTTPPASFGKGPHPAIITPHGGPWARDALNWDSSGWTQYFAARGYVVLQPQFRGSTDWGEKVWRAGDAQWGLKMQDDKDDGARWLIAQGLADPGRIAMHGYSYGGYSAMAAAVRPNGLYQCAVAGAGVADLADIKRETFNDSRFLREYQRPTIDGLDPLPQADKVSIPVFLYSGDRDTIVDIEQSEDFANALRRAGKPVKLLRLKDMGHTFNTWTPDHHRTSLEAVENYLKTDCGPGGL